MTDALMNENLVPVPALELRPQENLPFDLYVRLPITNRVILFRRQGAEIDAEIAAKMATQGFDLFVPRESYESYLQYTTIRFLGCLSKGPMDSKSLRMAAGRLLSNLFQQASIEETQALFAQMSQLVTRVVAESTRREAPDRGAIFDRFAKLAMEGSDFQRHPLQVASLTMMLAMGLGIFDQRVLVEVALAALLHDVGLTQLPVSIIPQAHQYEGLGAISKALIKLHPQGSVDLLRSRGVSISALMRTMILQHHESFSGQGFPSGVSGKSFHPMAQLLRVGDELADLFTKSDSSVSPKVALETFLNRCEGEKLIDPSLIVRLRELLLGGA